MKVFKRLMASALAATMVLSSVAFNTVSVSAAPSVCAGWNETLYAEWADKNPDSDAVKVGYKLSTDAEYTYLSGNDLTYLVRPASASGYGRVDIPGLKAGRYDIEITASDGTVHTRKSVQVYGYDRSGYAHFNNTEGVGAYNDDGTLKDNALVVYVTDENKDTVEIPGFEGHAPVAYSSSTSGASWTRETAGIGNILNNNHKYIREVTGGILPDGSASPSGAHPVVFRFVGEVTLPKNLTPYNTKTNELGGSKGDNGNLAITKYAKNITIEGIGDDATINGWGFTFSQTSTCPADTGKNLEVRNLTFKNYTEDGLGFQGDDPITCPIERVWVHNNVFYPGYCANPAESDKAEGDGSCDFKRGQYYTMSYNHYVNCHKTNLLGAGDSNDQYYMTLHHNWYQNVESRQPLASGGNVHIYNTFFDNATSTTIDLRGHASAFSEENYFLNAKNAYKTRKATSIIKTYNDVLDGKSVVGSLSGTMTVAATRDQSGLADNGLTFPNGDKLTDWDMNTTHFYYDPVNKVSNVEVLNKAADVPEYVKTYAGTLKAFPITESGEIKVSVKTTDGAPVADAAVTANGISFRSNGDGTYTATTVPLGTEYLVRASKEGYSNAEATTAVLENDGDSTSVELTLAVDYDGYAVVNLTGGTNDEPVKGAVLTLSNGSVMTDNGDGTYTSPEQIAVGDYTVTIANTGDYIAPAAPVAVSVKTTDAATDVHLDKKTGKVSVTLNAAAGETQTLNTERASVSVGNTKLTKDAGSNTFSGEVEVGTAYDVLVNVPGWNTVSVTPAVITANADTETTAEATFTFKGELFVWNYTEGINTNDFLEYSGKDWGDASKNPIEYEGESLTKALKMESSAYLKFEAPADGTVTVVTVSKKSEPTLVVNNEKIAVSAKGVTTFDVKAGAVEIKKGTTDTFIYYLAYAASQQEESADTTVSTESTSETTTDATDSTESTSETTSETTTETTTADVLTDEITWDCAVDQADSSNGLSFGEKFRTNSEEDGPRDFVEGDKTYQLSDWIQGTTNPVNKAGVNPQSILTEDHVPSGGAFVTFVPEKDGTFTVAAKTMAGKITYITDGEGNVITSIGSADAEATTYDVIRTEVEAGQTYYLYAGGSKICIYYLGYTSKQSGDDVIWGDADHNGILTANDASTLLVYILTGDVSQIGEDYVNYCDVDGNDVITANDCATILTKVLTGQPFVVEK